MRPSLSLGLTAAGASAAVLAAAPAALAADAVYGGASGAGDPIVVKANRDATQLRSIVVSWNAACGEGQDFPASGTLTAVKPVPGFSPHPAELVVSKNAKGRFKGVQFISFQSESNTAAASVSIEGTLKQGKATGKLTATVKIIDKATGDSVGSCQASQSWTAARA